MNDKQFNSLIIKCSTLLACGIVLSPAYALLLTTTASAQIYEWSGAQSDVWGDAGNWLNSTPPVTGATNSTTSINNATNTAIADGVTFKGGTLNVGSATGSEGRFYLTGNSNFEMNHVYVGQFGTGTLHVIDSILTANSSLQIGSVHHGHLILSGTNTRLFASGSILNIGNITGGYGKVEILQGAQMSVRNVSHGNLNGSGDLIVDGTGSALFITGLDLSAGGNTGDVSITVSAGGQIDIVGPLSSPTKGMLQLVSKSGTLTSLLLTGEYSRINTTGEARIAEFGTVEAKIDDKAVLSVGNKLIVGDGRSNYGSTGSMSIDNEATVNVSDDTYIGAGAGGGTGTVSLDNKAKLITQGDMLIGYNINSHGILTLNGNSRAESRKDIVIGLGPATGSVTVQGGSTLVSDGDLYLAQGHADAKGELNIGAAASQAAQNPGLIQAPTIYFGIGDGRLVFNHTADETVGAYSLSQQLDGNGRIENYSGLTRLTANDNSTFTGTTNIFGGSMWIDTILGGTMTIATAGRLQGIGTVGDTHNSGIIAPGNQSLGSLTIDGDYVGNGGLLEIEAALGNDGSPTDMLIIKGSASGTTHVKVINRNGLGDATKEGIKIIQVQDVSDSGAFTLKGDFTLANGQSAVGAGLYAYTLHQNGVTASDDGDWYLRSSIYQEDPKPDPDPDPDPKPDPDPEPTPPYQPGLGVYEAFPQILLGLNEVSTLQQRIGNRRWGQGENDTHTESRAIWARINAGHNKTKPRFSTTNAHFEQDSVELQAGLDVMLHQDTNNSVLGGLNLRYITDTAKIWSSVDALEGNGRIKTKGYGLGGTLTFYGENGGYLDGQAGLTWYNSDLSYAGGKRLLANDIRSFGYALSLEGGQRVPVNAQWSLTPQAQLSYSNVKFDDFTDTFNAVIRNDRGQSLLGRIGLSADFENSWRNDDNMMVRTHIYGIANLYYEFLNGTKIDIDGKLFTNQKQRLKAGLGFGGSYNWNNDSYSIYGEGLATSDLKHMGDSYSIHATLGLRVKW